jgi:succinate dehydrogenase hydrophobic anchor subunit
MVDRIHERTKEVVSEDGTTYAQRTRVIEDDGDADYVEARREPLAERIVWMIAGVLLTLLAFRFVLALLGANPNNAFANFIYSVSHPFVAPFFSLFGYDLRYGISRFETFTLVAMAVYAIVAFGIAKILTLGSRSRTRAYR